MHEPDEWLLVELGESLRMEFREDGFKGVDCVIHDRRLLDLKDDCDQSDEGVQALIV